MLDKLEQVELRFEKVNELICLPEVVNDQNQYKELMRELKNLTPVVECFRAYKEADETEKEASELLSDNTQEKEFKELLEEEFKASKQRKEELYNELKTLLLPKDPNDYKNVIIEIRGGAGGDEAALFAASLFRMYSMYAESRGWKTDVMNINETGLGGIKEISFMVEGEGAYSRFKFESGVHRVQRVPETESGGRIHTSTVTVAVLPEAEEVDIDIDPTDLQIDTYRASGAGGQHVNKTESAIRITHIPTG
ncbi:MAG: PCRF domain-containing protein, partial [Clostridia bacterium]|nr:PCRF domain-containing protein [Clostridia bacterium]